MSKGGLREYAGMASHPGGRQAVSIKAVSHEDACRRLKAFGYTQISIGGNTIPIVKIALEKARVLLDSVAFVASEGDTEIVLQCIDEALSVIAEQ